MEIKKTITLRFEKEGRNFICHDSNTVQMLLGVSNISDHAFYKIKKDRSTYTIPIKVVRERVKLLERRTKELINKLEIMNQVLK